EQIETFHPWIAVMLNFSPDHLDRHPTVDAYRAAKARIFENQDAGDWAVVNADDPTVLAMARRGRARMRMFSRGGPLVDGTVVDDSKATNVESALRSIESFDRDLVVILGGRFKGGDLRLLREPLRARAKAVVAIGESRALFRDALSDAIAVHEDDAFGAAIRR